MSKLFAAKNAEPKFQDGSIRSKIFDKVKAAGSRGILRENVEDKGHAVAYLLARKYLVEKEVA
jgi:hypothetical protein